MIYKIYDIDTAAQGDGYICIVRRLDHGLVELFAGHPWAAIATEKLPTVDEAIAEARAIIDSGKITRAPMP